MHGEDSSTHLKKRSTTKHKHPLRYPEIKHKEKADGFVNSWSIAEKQHRYDALEDPHASYYFVNKSVKQHLKGMKKAITDERNLQERNRLRKLITQKIKLKFQDAVCPKTSIYEKEIRSTDLAQLSKTSLKSLHATKTRSRFKSSKYLNKANRSENDKPTFRYDENGSIDSTKNPNFSHSLHVQLPQKQTSSPEHQSIPPIQKPTPTQQAMNNSLRITVELHSKRHDKFMKFIEEKKKLLQNNRKQEKQGNKYNTIQDKTG